MKHDIKTNFVWQAIYLYIVTTELNANACIILQRKWYCLKSFYKYISCYSEWYLRLWDFYFLVDSPLQVALVALFCEMLYRWDVDRKQISTQCSKYWCKIIFVESHMVPINAVKWLYELIIKYKIIFHGRKL